MNILVTGGAGFVGSHLCKRLSRRHKVFSLDNYFTGELNNHHDGVHYINGETKHISDCLSDIKIDTIFHLGEYSKVEQSFDDIDKIFEYNWNSIYEVLKFAKHKKAKFIYSGSSTKFGDKGQTIYQSPYAFIKYTNVELIKTYCDWFLMDYTITYFYNVYGKGEIASGKYATVVAKFLEMKKNGNQYLPVTLPGTQRRNFTHIEDIIDGLILVSEKGYGDGYGIGSREAFSILELAEMVGLPPKMMPEKAGNRMSAPIYTDKTRELGWTDKHKLRDYISF